MDSGLRDTESKPEANYVLSWSDLRVVFKRSKQKVLWGALAFALLAALFTLSREVTYIAQGTFREKNKQANANEKTLSALLLSGGATAAESMAVTTIKSRRVLEKVVQNLNLQGHVQAKDNGNFVVEKLAHYLKNIYHNLIVEEAYLTKKYKPVVADPPQELVAKQVEYAGEIALVYELHFTDDENFEVLDSEDRLVARGKLGELVRTSQAAFSIHKAAEGPLPQSVYTIAFNPPSRIAQNLLANLVVEADKLDKTLLKINYYDINRHRSSKLLNTVMNTYREFLVDEHVRVTAEQVAYLKERQEDMDKQLVVLMEDHAVNIASNDASIEFLVKTQQSYKSKLLNIDLETKHLEKAQQEGINFFERHSADGESPVVQNLLGEIRKYRQQADSLEIALRNTHVHSSEMLQNSFNQYVDELQELHQENKEARQLLAEVEEGNPRTSGAALMTNAKYMIKPWLDRLSESDNARQMAEGEEKADKEDEHAACQASFAAYLSNLLHLFEVQEKTIQDRLTHQQNPQVEFQGIDLETANGLFVTYSRELHSLEADLAQKEFIIQRLSQPEFEISSINSIMDDTISRDIINKASTLMLTIKDEPNRTTKELERLKRDIEIQKGFLTVHLKQMCDILRLREQLLEDKIHSLQSVILELIRQKISIQEKHLGDYINSRLNNLGHEKHVILQHQKELQKELDQLPEKWASQKLIDQHMQSNLSIVHQIASMIESKTIAENLEVSQSAPFDEAVVPVLPRDPRLFLFSAIGLLGGGFLTFCFSLIQSAARGVEATKENLRAIGQNVAGGLSLAGDFENIEKIAPGDLETLRKLMMHLAPPQMHEGQARRVVLIEGQGPQYAEAFAALLGKRGCKVLLIPLCFKESEREGGRPGLLDVLEGRSEEAKVQKGLYFDAIAAGGKTAFCTELLESPRFISCLDRFSAQYDWVVGYTDALPISAEGESLLSLFPSAAVTLAGEHLDELKDYFQAARNGSAVSFVFAEA